jgi:hypothetical protein
MTPSAVVQLRSMRTSHRQNQRALHPQRQPRRLRTPHTEHNDAGNIRHSFCTRAAAAPAVARGCQLSELLRQLSMPNPATRRAGGRID